MKALELRKKSKSELQKLLSENHNRLRQLKFDLAAGKVKNVREIRNLKKDIARILTLLREQPKSERGRENPSVAEWQRGGRRSDSLLRPSRLGKY